MYRTFPRILTPQLGVCSSELCAASCAVWCDCLCLLAVLFALTVELRLRFALALSFVVLSGATLLGYHCPFKFELACPHAITIYANACSGTLQNMLFLLSYGHFLLLPSEL